MTSGTTSGPTSGTTTAVAASVYASEDDPFAGAGIVSGYADLAGAVADGADPLAVGMNGVAVGLDTLGGVIDPVGTLLSAGVGWAIEHLSFLREPLDALMGDPDAIVASADSWHHLSRVLGAQAQRHGNDVAVDLRGWTGEAAVAYGAASLGLDRSLRTASRSAETLAEVVLASGARVGAVRAVVRDAVAAFVADLVSWLLATAVTAGAAGAAMIPAMLAEASALALRIADRIAETVRALDDGADALKAAVSGLLVEVRAVRAGEAPAADPTRLGTTVARLTGAGERVPVRIGVELGKEQGGQRLHEGRWRSGTVG
ncbi:MAG: hypothetical protein OJJ54_09195 [Pseudonocardia sp.]|nr:hypothetical protein [Pseudonocardia sp.]